MSYRSENVKRISFNNNDFAIGFGVSIYSYDEDISIPLRFTEKGKKKLKSNGLKSPVVRAYLTNEQYISFLLRSNIPDSKILLTSEVFEDPYEIDLVLLKNLWLKDKINILSIVINCYPFKVHFRDKTILRTKAYLETLVVEPK